VLIDRSALPPSPKFRQSTATIQLDQEEAACYRDVPVVLDFRSGFYVFPVRARFFFRSGGAFDRAQLAPTYNDIF
jgi:hypothetical protein